MSSASTPVISRRRHNCRVGAATRRSTVRCVGISGFNRLESAKVMPEASRTTFECSAAALSSASARGAMELEQDGSLTVASLLTLLVRDEKTP